VRRFLLRGSRVVLHSVVGGALVAAGLIMLLTPGPGLLVMVVGLAVLAREYAWAGRMQGRVLSRFRDASTVARARLASRRLARDTRRRAPSDLPLATPEDAGIEPEEDDTPGRVRPAS
jgi:hypothetical protein